MHTLIGIEASRIEGIVRFIYIHGRPHVDLINQAKVQIVHQIGIGLDYFIVLARYQVNKGKDIGRQEDRERIRDVDIKRGAKRGGERQRKRKREGKKEEVRE